MYGRPAMASFQAIHPGIHRGPAATSSSGSRLPCTQVIFDRSAICVIGMAGIAAYAINSGLAHEVCGLCSSAARKRNDREHPDAWL